MARPLTSTPRKTTTQTERSAKRIARQQKQLEKTLINEMTSPMRLTGASSRAIKLSNLKKLEPLTDTQEDFFESYADDVEAMVLYGSAGTGKSTIAMYLALSEILDEENTKEKLIIIRSTVQTRDQGFLKGSIEEKLEPFALPYHGICEFLIGRRDAYEKLVEMNKIEFISSSLLRGTTFDDSIILVDENQSMTWHELNTIATRVGNNTKIIFCGDYAQNDLITKKSDVSGFKDFLEVSKKMQEFRHFKFTTSDIVRSGFCKSWVIASESCGL